MGNGIAVSQKNKNRTGYRSEKNKNTISNTITYTPMFIAELFTIAKIRKQPKCPSTDEWIKKM